MKDIEVVFHLAAATGNVRSIKHPFNDCEVNVLGTLNVLEAAKKAAVDKLVYSSSAAIFGGVRYLPIDEVHPAEPDSPYGVSKYAAEKYCLCYSRLYNMEVICLRYFNVYGSRQSLSNPYTGACAIFTSRILNNKPPYIFEDGNQARDFIHVKDIAQANLNALEHSNPNYEAINVGTGKPITIIELAETLTKLYNKPNLKPYISNEYRKGDIRHCYADTQKMHRLLDFKSTASLQEGLIELAGWAKTHGWGAIDLFETALKELKEKHLAT